ncbi:MULTISPECIES: 50S ribosomal protein L28 [Dehalococcoides]|jgi:large subunit ribosomal protein L28|uniref:Large ribosomal subunit protein bL28 n=1 Tax=Dehalococcoides mccartyi (strain VS) TaxID=311424 RepID=D2BIL2_DEHMV|nr:50S ribosomal protein L28 [Dehalococcoides mccartyi]AHB13864.1 50S ribosomal protein L28 [Dehalococcoides mccartyi GY50]BAQ34987.1 50S ribosomal protein L28 [Dehalococcoides sp. UCH007]ACZ62162.1 ribosomal protein L28 [Dehalococcoides mccartyi VS]AII58220.1 50S ribosomal protein L28 [Dehalococcoides mccartyi CG1]APH12798.1 50S ribosomal protein L28 [Dehalococcoides mccartyi]
MKCEMCGKTPTFGHNVSHSKRRTNRVWMPNIHSAKVAVNGTEVRMKLCTRCIRSQAKLAKTA